MATWIVEDMCCVNWQMTVTLTMILMCCNISKSNEILFLDPSSNVTFTYTNNNRPTISAANTGQNSVQNTNNDRDTNTAQANNNLDNTGNNVTINNNGRRKRSLGRIVQDFRERQMTSIFERLIGDVQGKEEEKKSIS